MMLTTVGPFKPMRGALRPDDRSFALTNADLFTVSHGRVPNGTLIVRDGKIAEMRAAGSVPGNLPVLDLGGRVVLPGFVSPRAAPNDFNGDMNAQNENNENIEPIVPEMNARFAIEPWYPSFPAIREIGITTQNIAPMQLNLIGGSGVFIKNAGMDIAQMVRREPASMVFSVTRESASTWGNNSKIPTTPEAAAKMIGSVLDDARRYAAERPGRQYNQRLEALLPVLDGRIPAIIQAYDVEEIRLALKIAADHKLRLVVGGGVEAYKLAGELASAGASVILGNSGSNIGEYADHSRWRARVQRTIRDPSHPRRCESVFFQRERRSAVHADRTTGRRARAERGVGVPQRRLRGGGAEDGYAECSGNTGRRRSGGKP